MATPQSPKLTQYVLLFTFAVLPILLLVFVANRASDNVQDRSLVPILVAGAAVAAAIYWLMNRMGPDQTPNQFQTNMLITLAFGELCSLMGVFLGTPAGFPPILFVAANFVILVLAFFRVNAYWQSRPST